jgi:hypothetical protein
VRKRRLGLLLPSSGTVQEVDFYRRVPSHVVGTGAAAGSATVLTIPLTHLAPTDREFAVSLVRADRELDRTVWRPVPRRP